MPSVAALICIFATFSTVSAVYTTVLVSSLRDVLDFIDRHHYEINFDGLLGVVIAETQLIQNWYYYPAEYLEGLILRCEKIKKKIEPLIPDTPTYSLYKKYLLNFRAWKNSKPFVKGQLQDLGVYWNWTRATLLENKAARYEGIASDVCITEILEGSNCEVSPKCYEMMLENRIDTGYLLSHRLLYLQIARIKGCQNRSDQKHIKKYCSLMLKEARTNQLLGYPQHDILLEQILLCGMEGFEEFLTETFREKVVEWKNDHGCYYADYEDDIAKRSSNRIEFGCTDHATGLGAATLALILRYEVQEGIDK